MADVVAVTSTGATLDSRLDPRFGRCSHFIVFDGEEDFRAVPNDAKDLGNGAGIQAAQRMIDNGVTAIVTGNMGPNAFRVLSEAGIRVFLSSSDTVRSAIEMFRGDELEEIGAPSSPGHHGMGGGQRRGFGGNR